MENLPNEVLSQIFSYFDAAERVVLERVSQKFRDAMKYHDLDTIDIAKLEKFANRPIANRVIGSWPTPANMIFSSRHVESLEKPKKKLCDVEFQCSIFEKLVPKLGPKLTTVRFGDSHFVSSSLPDPSSPIEAKSVEVLRRLSNEYGSQITIIDFGRREVRAEALFVLPEFPHLRELTIYGADNRFAKSLGHLRLTTLKIGGVRSPHLVAHPHGLRRLHLFGEMPEKLTKAKAVLPSDYPNLEVLTVNMDWAPHGKCFGDWSAAGPDEDVTVLGRIGYIDRFKNLKQSNLFRSHYHLCLPYLVAVKADVVERIEELNLELPTSLAMASSTVYRSALDKIDSWPSFFDHFRAIRSIRITNVGTPGLKFRAADLFHLGSLDLLRKLELDELIVTIDPGEGGFISSMREEVQRRLDGGADDVRAFQSLEYLKIKMIECIRPMYGRGVRLEPTACMGIYDLFFAYVTVNSDRLKELDTNYISLNGWSYLVRFVDRLGSRCRLESVRVKCHGLCAAIDLSGLTTLNQHDVIWSNLRELSVWCQHVDLSSGRHDHQTWIEVDRENMKDIGIKFPRLRRLQWPEPRMTYDKFRMFADGFPKIRELHLQIQTLGYTIGFVELMAYYPNLERVHLESVSASRIRWPEEKTKEFERMVRDRRAIMAKRGSRETELTLALGWGGQPSM